MRNAVSEVLRANVMAHGDHETELLRMNLEPPTTPHFADGIDLGSIPFGVLDVYRLAITPVTFSHDRLGASVEQAWEWTNVTPQGEVSRAARPQGSNNWAVHGSRTSTGRPVLANDPHRLHSVPSLRYVIHLTAPGFDAIGAVEPTFPGITIGHNGDAAFGLTLFLGPDQEDVYVYETSPENPNTYKYQGAWEAMHVIDETFSIKNAPSQTLALKFTRHGPVVDEHRTPHRAFAIRSVWSEPGTAPYGASLVSMRARTFDQFVGAMRRWGAPAVNQVYADRHGDIAWITAGFSPVRKNWDGLLPVPGDGRYEWDGFLDPELLPRLRNPPSGFVASANAMNLPPDWNHAECQLGYEWDDPSRAVRIKEALTADAWHSVAASCALQTDVLSIPARRLSAILQRLHSDGADARRALAILGGWDQRVLADSGPAALYETWWSHYLKPALFERLVPDAALRNLILPGDIESILRSIEDPGPRLGASPARARDELLIASLAKAFRHCVSTMGADTASWSWGRMHRSHFEHALSSYLGSSSRTLLDVPALPLGGSDSTLMKAAYRPNDFKVVMGASVRIVVDVGDWDKSVCMNAPGQSGDPRSPHYADLASIWARGEYVPMLYSRGAIDRETEACIVLTPV